MSRDFTPILTSLLITLATGCPADDDAPANEDDSSGSAEDASEGPSDGPVTPDELAMRGSCGEANGAGTTHAGDVTADETWTAADGPHRVTANLRILAEVAIEPCALVLVAPGVQIEVGSSSDGGRLVAHGRVQDGAIEPVSFAAEDPASPWGRLYVAPLGEIDMEVVAIQNGGAIGGNESGSLVIAGVAGGTNTGDITRNARLDRTLVEGSASEGIHLTGWGAFTEDSSEVWVRDCGSADNPSAVRIEPGVASTLPADLVIAGNERDEILMRTSKAFMRDDVLADHGVPYRQSGALYVNAAEDGAPVTLAIEPGVTIEFDVESGSGMLVGTSETRQGVLVAEGTAEAPILFTSAQPTPAAGDWMGLVFHYVPTTGSALAFTRIEYAGGESGTTGFGCGPSDNDAAVIIHGQGPDQAPPDAFVHDVEFDDIAGETVIVSGWVDAEGPDLSEGNTFGASTGPCKVSRPRRDGTGDVCDGGRDVCWD